MRLSSIKILTCLAILILFGFACREQGTEPRTANFQLTAEDVGVTDAYLHVKATLSHGPWTVMLKRDGQQILHTQPSNYITYDTLILEENLLPKHNYSYKAYYFIGSTPVDSSAPLQIITMDTTSHNFIFELDTLGDGNSSALYDVAIINDTTVVCVGDINIKDSLGNWEEPYGAAIWNNKSWRLQRLLAWTPSGYVSILRPHGIFAFSASDIWLASGGVHHWDGKSMYVTPYWINSFPGNPNPILLPGQSAEKLWGISSTNIYVVGNQGAIAHFDGSSWQKMNSGTDVNLTDVYGSPDGNIVWACGYYESLNGTFLLRNTGTGWEFAYDGTSAEFQTRPDSLSGTYTSIYTPSNKRIFVLSDAGVYSALANTKGAAKGMSFPSTWSGFPWRLRGNAVNDLFIVGEYYSLAHYNGMTLKHYGELGGYGRLVSVAQHNNIVIAVGYLFHPIHSRGIVFRGRK